MSLLESRKQANENMQNGLEKIKGAIFVNKSNSDNKAPNEAQQNAINQIKSGADSAKDFCNNSVQSQKAEQNLQSALKDYENTQSDSAMQNVSNAIKDMQRAVGLQQMQNGMKQIQQGIQNAHSNINSQQSLNAGKQIMQGIQGIQQGIQQGSLQQANAGMKQIQQGISSMQSANSANQSMANQGIQQMQDGMETVQGALNNMCNKDLADSEQLNDMGDASVDKMQSGENQLNQEGNQGQQGSQGQGGSQGQNGSSGSQGSIGSQGSNGQSAVKSANHKMSQGMSSLSEALGQGNSQGQQGQGSSQQGQGGSGSGSGDVNRNADGTPKNPFADASQKGQGGGGAGGISASIDGASGNGGNGQGDINKTPSQAGQGKDVNGQGDSQNGNIGSSSGDSDGNGNSSLSGNGVSPGFSRNSYSTKKKSGIADTTKTGKSGMDQSFMGKPQYGANDFASGKKNIDQSLQKKVTVTYNGKKITGTVQMDVLSNHDKLHQQAGGSATTKRIEESKMALQRIKTKLDMERKKGSDLDKDGAGQNSNRFVEFGLETKMSWKSLLRKCLQQERRGSSYSYLQPNRRYSNMGMTVVSRVKDKKVEVIKNVKVAVDTSGSVSTEELNLYLSQIARLTKEFDNVEGELLYWSNAVTDVGEFKNIEDLKKIHVGSTGGTDVRCVFEYLNGETKCNGHREEHKPKEMAAIIIITDGCFYNNYDDYAEIFGKPNYKVIWMIEGDAMNFKPPFGNVVQITRRGD